MANFPTSLPSATPADHGELVGEVAAIATELGLDPSGSAYSTVGARLDALPRGTLGYAEITTSAQSGLTAPADVTGLSSAVTVAAGRRVRISYELTMSATAASQTLGVQVKEGSTVLRTKFQVTSPTAGVGTGFSGSVVLTPSTGAHTYKLAMTFAAGTPTWSVVPGGLPDFIHVEDVGT